jgi:hypothetical protein
MSMLNERSDSTLIGLLLARRDRALLQITQQTSESALVGIVVLPLAEIPDVARVADIGSPGQGGLHDLLIQLEGKKDELIVGKFLFQCGRDHMVHPGAVDRVLRKHHQQLIVEVESLVEAGPGLLITFEVYRGEPTAHIRLSQVGMQAGGEIAVLAGRANTAGVELDGVLLHERTSAGNEGGRQASLAQEGLSNIPLRAHDGIRSDGRGTLVSQGFQSLDCPQVKPPEDSPSDSGPSEVGVAKVGPTEIRSAEVAFSEVCASQVGIAEIRSAEIRSTEVSKTEVGKTEVGKTEIGFAEVSVTKIGLAEICSAEVGFPQSGIVEVSSMEVGSAEIGAAEMSCVEIRLAKIGSAEIGSIEVGLTEIGSTKVCPAEIGFAEVGLNEVGSTKVCPAKTGSAEVGFSEIRVEVWRLLVLPGVPGGYSSQQSIQVLLVGHRAFLLCGVLIIEACWPIRKHAALCKSNAQRRRRSNTRLLDVGELFTGYSQDIHQSSQVVHRISTRTGLEGFDDL